MSSTDDFFGSGKVLDGPSSSQRACFIQCYLHVTRGIG